MKIVIAIIVGMFAVLTGGCGWINKAANVVEKELDPSVLLKKYEWFKDTASQCDKKMADIMVYKNRLSSMEKSYDGVLRKDWDRTDKEQYNLWEQEIAGVVASYNGLAAEYNSNMAKINYSFTNIGELPKGANQTLPREMREYQYK